MQPDSNHINQLLANPSLLAEADMVDLQFWAIEYPQVPLFRMFLAKKAIQSHHAEEEQYRMEAAALVSDRSCLYSYLSQNKEMPETVDAIESIDIPVERDSVEPEPERPVNILPEVTAEIAPKNESIAALQTEVSLDETSPVDDIQVAVSTDTEIGNPTEINVETPTEPTPELHDITPDSAEVPLPPSTEKSAADELLQTLHDLEPDPALLEGIPDTQEVGVEIIPTEPPLTELSITPVDPEEVFDFTVKLEHIETQSQDKSVKVPDAGLHSFIEWLDLIDKQKAEGAPRIPVKEDWIEAPTIDYFPKLADELPPADTEKKPIAPETPQNLLKPEEEVVEIIAPANKEEQDVVKQAQLSLEFSENLMTETLAKLYTRQGKNAKAIKIYKALALHNPEKSSYFAALIQQLES